MSRAGWITRLTAPMLIMALTACGAEIVGRPQSPPSRTGLPAEQLVFLVESIPGYVPAVIAALDSPALAVYGDGRVITYDEHEDGHEVPVAYTVAEVDPILVAEFASRTEALHLIEDGTDFGEPGVTDMPYTTVRLHGQGAPQFVTIYAFSEDFERDLSPAERKVRRELSAVIDRARALPGDSAATAFRPDRVRILEVDYPADTERHPAWPGPSPDSFLGPSRDFDACGTLTGPAAANAYAAARKNPGAVWTVGSTQRTLAVVALLPGTIGCPP